MARRTVIDCDVCKKESPVITTITLATDRVMDPAGGYDTETQSVDLCPKCAGMRLNQMLDSTSLQRSYDQNKAAIKFLRLGATSELEKALGIGKTK